MDQTIPPIYDKKIKAIVLTKFIFTKIVETLTGIESGCYKIAAGIKPIQNFFSLQDLCKNTFKNMLKPMLVNQFNIEYNALANKDDFRIIKEYNIMREMIDHSPICLINIIFNLAIAFIDHVDRSKLDTSSLENYLDSIKIAFIPMANNVQAVSFSGMFIHHCDGPRKVEPLPPGQQMFNIEGVEPKPPSKSTTNRCMVCVKETNKSCSGCKTDDGPSYYLCSAKCQKIDWPTHPKTCRNKQPRK